MMHFEAHLPDQPEALAVSLNLPGVHNVRNALGAMAIAWELGLDLPADRSQPGLLPGHRPPLSPRSGSSTSATARCGSSKTTAITRRNLTRP